ncbi:unnamed protein product [Coccothraustes coccothraustes]
MCSREPKHSQHFHPAPRVPPGPGAVGRVRELAEPKDRPHSLSQGQGCPPAPPLAPAPRLPRLRLGASGSAVTAPAAPHRHLPTDSSPNYRRLHRQRQHRGAGPGILSQAAHPDTPSRAVRETPPGPGAGPRPDPDRCAGPHPHSYLGS